MPASFTSCSSTMSSTTSSSSLPVTGISFANSSSLTIRSSSKPAGAWSRFMWTLPPKRSSTVASTHASSSSTGHLQGEPGA